MGSSSREVADIRSTHNSRIREELSHNIHHGQGRHQEGGDVGRRGHQAAWLGQDRLGGLPLLPLRPSTSTTPGGPSCSWTFTRSLPVTTTLTSMSLHLDPAPTIPTASSVTTSPPVSC